MTASDEGAGAWAAAAKELLAELPGDWVLRRRRSQTVLVREPVDWTLTWVGLSRPRNTNKPFVMAGVVPLVKPFALTAAPYGLRSDTARQPGTFDLLSDSLRTDVRNFLVEDALPLLERWTPDVLAQRAEEDLARPAGTRHAAEFTQAAGWRVVNNSGSPVDPARESAELLREREGEEDAAWFEALIAAWDDGGRPSALEYLEKHKSGGLKRLKLV